MNAQLLVFFLIFSGRGGPPSEVLEAVATATPNVPNGSKIEEFAAPVQPVSHSFEGSCWNIMWSGGDLCATCKKIDGGENWSCLADVDNCPGDIANHDGQLSC